MARIFTVEFRQKFGVFSINFKFQRAIGGPLIPFTFKIQRSNSFQISDSKSNSDRNWGSFQSISNFREQLGVHLIPFKFNIQRSKDPIHFKSQIQRAIQTEIGDLFNQFQISESNWGSFKFSGIRCGENQGETLITGFTGQKNGKITGLYRILSFFQDIYRIFLLNLKFTGFFRITGRLGALH